MALEIKNKTIVGTINDIHSMNGIGLHDNLQEKLNGELPINRLELLYLINSWGRDNDFYTDENIIIPKCKAKECYDLSKLDTSEIIDMSQLFEYSVFNDIHSTNGIGLHNGDISNWVVSNVTDMYGMFRDAKAFNQPLDNWKTYNVLFMDEMFCNAESFNQDINSWDISKVKDMGWMFNNAKNFDKPILWDLSKVETLIFMFYEAKAFQDKFNNGDFLPKYTRKLKEWFVENRDIMMALNINDNDKKELDNYFENIINENNLKLNKK